MKKKLMSRGAILAVIAVMAVAAIGLLAPKEDAKVSAATAGSPVVGGVIGYNDTNNIPGNYLAATDVKIGDVVRATITLKRPTSLDANFTYKFSESELGNGFVEGVMTTVNNKKINPNDAPEIAEGDQMTYVLEITATKDYPKLYLQVMGGDFRGAGSTGDVTLIYDVSFYATPAASTSSVAVKYVDAADGTTELEPSSTTTGTDGTTITTAAAAIQGYDLADVKVDGVSVGVVGTYTATYGTNAEVIYYYAATPQPNIGTANASYVGSDGSVLSAAVSASGNDGDPYTFVAPTEINGKTISTVTVDGVAVEIKEATSATTFAAGATATKTGTSIALDSTFVGGTTTNVVFTYVDPAPVVKPSVDPAKPSAPSMVATGDNSNVNASVAMLSVSFVAMVFIAVKRLAKQK